MEEFKDYQKYIENLIKKRFKNYLYMFDDLMAEAALHFHIATMEYSDAKGCDFKKFVLNRVRQRVTDYLRLHCSTIRLPKKQRDKNFALTTFKVDFYKKYGRQPTLPEIEEQGHREEIETKHLLDDPIYVEDYEGFTLSLDNIPDQMRQDLVDYLGGMSFGAIADRDKTSHYRARKRVFEAIYKVRNQLGKSYEYNIVVGQRWMHRQNDNERTWLVTEIKDGLYTLTSGSKLKIVTLGWFKLGLNITNQG